MIKYVCSKTEIEYDVIEAYIEVDYDIGCIFDDSKYLKYCVQGLIPGGSHFPEVVTLEVREDVKEAIRIHRDIMERLGLCDD